MQNLPRLFAAFAALAALAIAATPPASAADEAFESWPLMKDPFPSTGGGGVMIHDYNPVVADGKCTTNFRAIPPDGTVFAAKVVFDAVPTQGGILCTNGAWKALDGSNSGTTPYRVFIKDGVKRGSP